MKSSKGRIIRYLAVFGSMFDQCFARGLAIASDPLKWRGLFC